MQYVHFLNIEYLLLRVYDYFFALPIVTGSINEAQAPASDILHTIELFIGEFALLGMAITLVLFGLIVWVRVRLVVVEHEGFEEKEEEEHAHHGQHVGIEPQEPVVKNPRWERVHELANSTNESDWRLAILEADIMLGDMLRDQGYRGDSIGERLRDANPLQFSTLDLAWKAHKVRNDIAHAGSDFHLGQREANSTIDLYRRVFEEFNYI